MSAYHHLHYPAADGHRQGHPYTQRTTLTNKAFARVRGVCYTLANSVWKGFGGIMAGTIVDMHVHTVRGAADSSLTPEQLVEEANRVGLTGVNISEHDRMWEMPERERFRRRSGLFISYGMEVSTDMGHILAIGLNQYMPGIRRISELRRAVLEVGGFMIVAHPFRHFFDPVHFLRNGREPFDLTPEEAAKLPVFNMVDEIEVVNGACTPRENYFALQVAHILGKRGTGGSDAHSTSGLGYCTTVFERQLEDSRQMLEELRAGRFYPAFGLNNGQLTPFDESSKDMNLGILRSR